MQTQIQKQPTTKQYAEFTLLVDFKPAFFRINRDAGEVTTRWTYRDDVEAAKFEKNHNGEKLKRKIDSLGKLINSDLYKYAKARFYGNNLAHPLIAEWNAQGKMIYPVESKAKEKVITFLNLCK